MLWFGSETERISKHIMSVQKEADRRFLENEINKFLNSPARADMITGEKYYRGNHAIKQRKRTVIGRNGKKEVVENLPNNRIVDNQYGKMVDQKNNYLLSKMLTINCQNEKYRKELNKIFGSRAFQKKLNRLGLDCLNGGIGWLYVFYNDESKLDFKIFKPYEVLPFWGNEEHTQLDSLVRIYNITQWTKDKEEQITKVELYTREGIRRFELHNGYLYDEGSEVKPYFGNKSGGYGWGRIPVIAFKQNPEEIPLIKRVKSLQDSLNEVRSDFMNNMQEDARNTILIIKNYDGENLEEFRKNLTEYGCVKVSDGDVSALKVDINSENYVVMCDMLKKAIIENARGYDARDERMNSSPNQMNILSMYSDIDLDANGQETEFQASLHELLYFINKHLENTETGRFENDEVEFVFNKDQLINESDVIENCKKSVGILSERTMLKNHPWVGDVDTEMEIKKNEEEEAAEDYDKDFEEE